MDAEELAIVQAIRKSGESTWENAAPKAKRTTELLFNVSLKIAVTGKTGSGKSSFVNALRGLDDNDPRAAPTGVTETTMEVTEYEHPAMPNVKICDLPGIGSSNFRAKQYLKDVQFSDYDFFIILSSERFTENDIKLAKEIRKQKKNFYFVRSKIDCDISAERRRPGFDEQNILRAIKTCCQKNLEGMGNPPVFLISSFELEKYDFETLQNTLLEELPEHKRAALLQAWPVSSAASLEKKIKMFEGMIWALSIASAGTAVVPVPGLSVACDATMVVGFLTRCYYSFGLDERSLTRLSEKVNKPHLKEMAKSKYVTALREKALLKLQASAAIAAVVAVGYGLSLVPGIGTAAAAGLSFATTMFLLREGLNDLANTARAIRREAGIDSM